MMQNKTNIDPSPYVPINFLYYENSSVDLSLSKEELIIGKLINIVCLAYVSTIVYR